MLTKEENEQIENSIRELEIALHGFDISKLSVKEQKQVEAMSFKRWELEGRLNSMSPPVPVTEEDRLLTKKAELKIRILEEKLSELDKSLGIKSKSKRGV